MVRTINDATVRAFHDASIDGLRRHVREWSLAYNYANYAKRLKALRFKAPLEAIEQISAEKPPLFTYQPSCDMLGQHLNSGVTHCRSGTDCLCVRDRWSTPARVRR